MIDGLIIVNKPIDYTSRDVVNKVSKILKTKKIGHTGTLDPIATGVLVLTIGKATKISEIITNKEKEYIAEAILGIETDTLDITGICLKDEKTNFQKKDINNVLNSFIGIYNQQVPIYSAIKVNGKKLYEYARNKEEIELPSRKIEIKEIELLDLRNENNHTIIKFRCLVSKGTYIRSLIRDISYELNTVGVMKSLIRTKQGNFNIKNSYTIDDIENNNYQEISIMDALKDYYKVIVDEKLKFKIINGQFIDNIYNKEYVLFTDNDVIALYKNIDGKLKPFKMFI